MGLLENFQRGAKPIVKVCLFLVVKMKINLMVIFLGRVLAPDLKDTQGLNWSWQSHKPRPHSDRQGDPGWSCDQRHLCGPLGRCGGESCTTVFLITAMAGVTFALLMCHSCLRWVLRWPCFEKPRLHSLPHILRCKQPLTCPGWFHSKHSHTVFLATNPLCFSSLQEDPVKYYTWRTFGPQDQRTQELWVDMSDIRRADRVHGILSNSYKQAVVSFQFCVDVCALMCGPSGNTFSHTFK